MRCEVALKQLNARADGELAAEELRGEGMPSDDGASLDAHLAECAQCSAVAEGLFTIDADLRRAFAPRREAAARLADRTAALVRATTVAVTAPVPQSVPRPVPQQTPQSVPARNLKWLQAPLAMAAGFLVAVGLFRPWQPTVVAPVSTPKELAPIARLAVATGPVEMRTDSKIPFFTCPTNAPIARDSIVRTGPSERCEIALDDGNALRLDCNTEVKLHQPEVVEVSRGRLWSCGQPGRKGIEIKAAGGTIVAQPATQLAVDCQPDVVRVMVVEGMANVRTDQQSQEVGPGRHVRVIAGRVEDDPEPRDALLETAWVNSVLALSSSDHPELLKRVNQLLANVGAAKLSLLYEDELRRLGDGGVPPLLAYLNSTRDAPQVAPRATAARIVADVAESRWIADLIALLTDANGDVRFQAARGLERLTGRDQGRRPESWQSESWGACESAYDKWLAWWKANRDRYPAAHRELSAPTAPPF